MEEKKEIPAGLKAVSAIQDESGDWFIIPSDLVSKFYQLDLSIGSENEPTSVQAQEDF